ncbi:MAG: FTR1 family protein [Acidobacteria bacterium]|nr:FTR1 family protein [Acidobacteriota bacterium]
MNSNFRIAFVLTLGLAPGACQRAPVTMAPGAPASDGGDAQRLVALVDYVAGDYGLAVKDGVEVSALEYQEQVRFVADARALARRLLGPDVPEGEPLLRHLARAEALVLARADAAAVTEACRAARDAAVTRLGLHTSPAARPHLGPAEALYAGNCAACHGASGDGDTERARHLDPRPAAFTDPDRLRELSPYRVYNALTFGVPGTAMASFEALSPAERWDLAFYVFRLGHAGREARGPVALPLAEMATRSDHELLETLSAEGAADPAAALTWARREAPFTEPPAAEGIERTRRVVREALAAFATGRGEDADRLVLDAYLSGFEPLEPGLRARDADATAAVEAAFFELRGALREGDALGVRARGARLDGLLRDVAGAKRPIVPFAAAFLIYLREGIEAALLVGALLAGLRRLGRPEAARWVHVGWIAAIPAGVATWWALDRVVSLGADRRELVEAVVALLAAAVLFSVSFWLVSKAESRHWMAYLRRNLEAGLSRRKLSVLAGLAFLAVYREAAETILFTQAVLLEARGARAHVWAGAAAGLLAVAATAALMNRTVLRLPLGPFFAVSGVLLCALAISFAGSGIHDLVAAGYLPPRPVRFPEVPWMGIHPDLTGLLVQLAIVLTVAAAGVAALRRPEEAPAQERARRSS